MKNRKKFLAMVLAGAMVLGLVACGNENSSSEAKEGESKDKQADSKITVGYSFPGSNNEFWGTNALDSAKQAGDALGFELIADDCNYDQAEQVADVESMISSGINVLVLAPQDASVCAGITASCKTADIPVVIIDRWPGDDLKAGEDYVCFIGPDDEQAGYDIAMSLIDAGCTKILGVGGVQGTSVGEGRKAGLDKALKENPDVELLQFEYAGDTWDDGDQAFRNLYQAHPEVDGVWCFNDSMALASVNILKEESKLDTVKVGGMDLLSNSVESMEAKQLWFSTGGHYMESGFAAVIAYDVASGVKYEAENKIQMSLLCVDQTNVEEFKGQFLDKEKSFDWAGLSKAKNPETAYNFDLKLE